MSPPRPATGLPGVSTTASQSVPAAVRDEAMRFLDALYRRAPSGVHVEMRPFAPPWSDRNQHKLSSRWRCWRPVEDPGSLIDYAWKATSTGPGLDIYIGVALRRQNGGTATDVRCVTALWAELDGAPSKKGAGCASRIEAWDRLQDAPIAPSIIVDSGGGFHAYWLLDSPITGDDLRHVPLWNARLREMLKDDRGYAGDDVGDLPRILRLPGTTNYKLEHQPRPVRLAHCDTDTTYSLGWLDQQLPALPVAAFRPGSDALPTPESSPMSWDDDLMARRRDLVTDAGAAWAQSEGVRHFLPHPMARVLLVAGWPWADIPALVGEIATTGGSADASAREDSARKELGDRGDRNRVGWPWMRNNAAAMADALDRHLSPRTDDLHELAAHVASMMLVAPPAQPALAQPAPASLSSDPMPAAPLILPPPIAPRAKLTAIAGSDAGSQDGRAAERVYNLLRDRLQWLGVGREDARPYGGRKRFDGHREVVETIALDGREAQLWALEVVKAAGLSLTETHRSVALDLLAAEARHTDVGLSLRYAQSPGGNWLIDLGDDSWDRVCIAPGHWRIEASSEPTFLRTACTLPYTAPDVDAQPQDLVDGLMAVLHCDEEVVAQLACWMVQALHPSAPRMGLFVTGPQGSGKSTFARLARRIVDPARPDLIKFTISKRQEVDYQTANVHKAMLACVAYSNVSSLCEAASDFLCGLITGDGHIARALYSNVDPILSEGRRCLVIEGISVLGMGADLQDRLLHLSLPMRTGFEPEAAFERRAVDWMPRIIGGLFATAAEALQRVDSIEGRYADLLNRCRMRDAAAYYGAAAEAMGYDAGDMLSRLVRARSDTQGNDAETDIVGQKLLAYVDGMKNYTGAEVYNGAMENLEIALHQGQKPHDLWPKSMRAFRARIERLVPGLRAKGIAVEFFRSKTADRRASVILRRIDVDDTVDEDRPIVSVRFGTVMQSIVDFIDQNKAFGFDLAPLFAAGNVAGYEQWVAPMQAIRDASPSDRLRIADALARKYTAVHLDGATWYETTAGTAQTWAQWLDGAMRMLDTARQ